MKLKTVRVRRSRPSTLSIALALMITMLCVYLGTLASLRRSAADAASHSAYGSSEVRMEGMEIAFDCEGRYATMMEAQVISAFCAQSGGAGLILKEDGQYAVVRDTAASPSENGFRRSAPGLRLQLSGAADEIAAISEAADFLYAQACETGSLADSLESGDTDAASLAALMNVYITQARKIQTALETVNSESAALDALQGGMENAISRLKAAASVPDAGKFRLLHAAACADWIDLLQKLAEKGDA